MSDVIVGEPLPPCPYCGKPIPAPTFITCGQPVCQAQYAPSKEAGSTPRYRNVTVTEAGRYLVTIETECTRTRRYTIELEADSLGAAEAKAEEMFEDDDDRDEFDEDDDDDADENVTYVHAKLVESSYIVLEDDTTPQGQRLVVRKER